MKKWPANIMTAGNLFCGFFAIIAAFDGHPQISAWLILFAAVLDAFDGKAARLFGGGSKFGIQFDSMADMVSFGVAPAALIYAAAFNDLGIAGLIVAFVPALAVAVRLARFNVSTSGGHHDFIGLSSPLHACLIASFVVMSFSRWDAIMDSNVLAGLVLTTCALMISRLPLPGLPRFTLREPGYNLVKVSFLLVCLGFMVINPPQNTFPALAVLVVGAFAVAGAKSIAGRHRGARDGALEDDLDAEPVPVHRGRR
ncbi:CDP-diacylglycerol--serine O-phosphatidyltransferase [candidate division KSB1 bacterium]|nr:CDP-diacylglycerol--serine O-phosphatidyltransferase [candidate division KSB1 bacterium]